MNWLKKNSVMPGLTGQLIAVVLFLLSFPLQAQDVLSGGNWTREQVADGIVTLSDGSKFLAVGDNDETALVEAVTEAAQWRVVTYADRLKTLEGATAADPVDVTFAIKDANFNRNDLRKSVDHISDEMYNKHLHPERFIAQLVNDPEWAAANLDCNQLMRDVFDIAGSLQGHQFFDMINLYHYFNSNEIFELWRLKNIYWYIHWANAPQNGNRMPFIERALLRDMVQKADDAIATGERGASLRFGHETCVLPLACLMELDSVNYSCDDLETLHEHWQDYNTIPKACNIQMVFYRPTGTTGNPASDILVKVLLNEHEALLPVKPVQGPYYRWTDLRQYYDRKLATAIDWSVKK